MVMKVKVGRNEPCPCGSGKKYKRCCLPLDKIARRPVTDDATIIGASFSHGWPKLSGNSAAPEKHVLPFGQRGRPKVSVSPEKVLTLALEGKSTRVIAQELNISKSTVANILKEVSI